MAKVAIIGAGFAGHTAGIIGHNDIGQKEMQAADGDGYFHHLVVIIQIQYLKLAELRGRAGFLRDN